MTELEHITSMDVTDDVSKNGRRKRTFAARCTCGWADNPQVLKWVAKNQISEHLVSVGRQS